MSSLEFMKEELRKSMGFSPVVPEIELKGRMKRFREQLESAGAAGMVIYGSPYQPDLVRYLANYVHPIKSSESLLILPANGEPVLLIDRLWFVDHAREMSFSVLGS